MTALVLAEEVTGEGRDADGHTYLGLGLIALILVVLWLIRRTKA